MEHLQEAIEEHQAILDAVKARDSDQAAEIMRAHVSGFQDKFASLL